MNDFCFTGRIAYIGEVQTSTTAQGSAFSRREIQVETIEEYPSSIIFELTQEKAINCSAIVGQMAKAHLNFRVYKTSTGRLFNSIRCWNLEIVQ